MNQSLKNAYAEVFSESISKDCSVADAGCWQGSVWTWNVVEIVGILSKATHNFCVEFSELLEDVIMDKDVEDSFVWLELDEGLFSVKICYSLFDSRSAPYIFSSNVTRVLNHCWSSATLDNIRLFGWRLLHGRVPSKDRFSNVEL